jgi:hypothetical protein
MSRDEINYVLRSLGLEMGNNDFRAMVDDFSEITDKLEGNKRPTDPNEPPMGGAGTKTKFKKMNFNIKEKEAGGVLRHWDVERVFDNGALQKVAEVISSDKITVVSGQYRNWVFNAPLITEGMTLYDGSCIDKSRWTNKARESSQQEPTRADGKLNPDFAVVLEMIDAVCVANIKKELKN